MKNLFIALVVLLTLFTANAQKLSEYKYIVVPAQFILQKKAGEYNLNSLVASTFKKFDFETMIEGDVPPVGFEPCKALKVSANKKGFLNTRISLSLKDCFGQIVHTTIEGNSREKDFQKSYYEAFRGAFEDPYIQGHKYTTGAKTPTVDKVEKSRQEIIAEAKRQLAAEEAEERLSIEKEKLIQKNTIKSDYTFEFLGKHYNFKKSLSGFDIFSGTEKLGVATKLANGQYKVNAGALSGKGFFDAFGNFVLKRINPINQQELTDTLARIQ